MENLIEHLRDLGSQARGIAAEAFTDRAAKRASEPEIVAMMDAVATALRHRSVSSRQASCRS